MQRIRWHNSGSLADWWLITLTTASLSEWKHTVQPRQCWPHTTPATTIGNSSFGAILADAMGSRPHGIWYHSPCQTAPQPHPPDASDQTWTSGVATRSGRKIDVPFHDTMNVRHHSRSARHSLFRRMVKCCLKWCVWARRSYILLRKMRPGRTTLLACCSIPTSDSRSLRWPERLPCQTESYLNIFLSCRCLIKTRERKNNN